jgi:hypothetical protein
MKKFLLNLTAFLGILALIFFVGLKLPATPRTSKTFLFAQILKDSLLINTPSPRIIFIGGSNLSFGLNSQMVKDSLNLNPINTAIHLNIGIIYMIDHTLEFIKPGDVVVVAPEYQFFYGQSAYGGEELLITSLDIPSPKPTRLNFEQWKNVYGFSARYVASKFLFSEYSKKKESEVYGISTYNQYGDATAHWNMKPGKFEPYHVHGSDLNTSVIKKLIDFKRSVEKKGAVLFITFPGYQATSFDKNTSEIKEIESTLRIHGFTLLGTPDRYKMPDQFMFDTPYHLLKQGVDLRTNLLIVDLKKQLEKAH